MKKLIILILLISANLTSVAHAAEVKDGALEIFVAPSGSDSSAGTINAPLATLDGARVKVRKLKTSNPDTPITVYFREGEYFFDKTVNFTQAYSGASDAKITYAAYNNEKPIFSGSKKLNPSAFKPVTDPAVRERLLPEVRDKIGQLDLREQGLGFIEAYTPPWASESSVSYPILYLNNAEQPLSKWPNDGYSLIERVVTEGGTGYGNNDPKPTLGYSIQRADRWATAKDMLIEGSFKYDYVYERVYIDNVNPSAKTITLAKGTDNGIDPNHRFLVMNLLEEIDIPGEYYIDREKMLLYYYTPYSLADKTMELSVLTADMLWGERVSDIVFSGITFQNSRASVGVFNKAARVSFKGCTIKNMGHEGITFSDCENALIDGCDFSNMAATCVNLSGGDLQTLTPSNNTVKNSTFYKLGTQTRTYAGAVRMNGVGCVVENNVMHEAPHLAVIFSGNNHKVRYNEMYNLVKETSDSGAIYTGRSFVMRGNEVAYNYFHDIRSSVVSGNHAVGMYEDDEGSGDIIHHNIFKNCDLAILVGGGKDNLVYNNIIADCTNSVLLDNRGEGWQRDYVSESGTLYKGIFEVPWNKPPYSTQYPELANIFKASKNLGTPIGNVLSDNLLYNSGEMSVAESAAKNAKSYENNITINSDTSFKDVSRQDYSVIDEDILKKIPGLKETDMKKIGNYADEIRKSPKTPIEPFRLISPKNGETDVNNVNFLFRWEYPQNADGFILTVARDPDMKDVVLREQTRYNFYRYKDQEAGLKSFYWTVEAFNNSLQSSESVLNRGTPFLYTTPLYDMLDKTELTALVAQAEKAVLSISEGDKTGEYKSGTKDSFLSLIADSKEILSRKNGKQADIDLISKKLSNKLDGIVSNINSGYVNLDNFVKNPSGWTSTGGKLTFDNDWAALKGGITAYTATPILGYELLTFKLQADFNQNWFGISAKQEEFNEIIWASKQGGYFIVVKPDVIEFQKWSAGNVNMLKTVPNTFIRSNEIHEIQLGVLTGESSVRLIMKVDGAVVCETDDKNNPLRRQGYFMLTDQTDGGYVKISGVSALPSEPYTPSVPSGEGQSAEFEREFDLSEGWQGIGIRVLDSTAEPWSTDCYLLVLKSGSIELQRFNKGKSEFLGIVDNRYVKSGEKANFEITLEDIDDGTKISVKVNGREMFNLTDTHPVDNNGIQPIFYSY